MKRIFTIFLLVFFTGFFSYSQTSQQPLYSADEVYIKLKQLTKAAEVKKASPDVNIAQELPFLLNKSLSVISAKQPFYYSANKNLLKTYRVKFKAGTEVAKVIGLFKADSTIEYIEPIPIYKLDYIPNDPSIGSQYHLGRIKAYETWDITKGGVDIPVAVVDDAVQINHPDIAANVVPGWDVVDNDNDPSPSSTDYSHGTHVAGIIGAVSDNGIGIASVGLNKAKIMGVRCSNWPGYITHGYEGIAWAANNGAKIINMSWGGTGFSSTAQEVINDAHNLGVILVAAAGNSSTNSLHYPSAYDNVVAVASTTSTDALSYFSNYGTWVDICAPGSDIYSTVPFNTYDTYSGTSMASPLTAGALAFIWSVKSTLSGNDVINLLKINADNIDSQNPSRVGQLGAGRINLHRAINCTDFQASITPLGPLVLCNSGSNFTLTATTVEGATYQWIKNNGTVSEATSTSISVNTAGSYAVAVTKNNCTLTSNAVNVGLFPSTATIISNRTPATLCNDSLILSAPNIAGVSYQWEKNNVNISGAITRNLTVNQSGTYKVIISAAGCTAVTSNEIVVDGLSLFINPSGPVVLCEGESQLLTIPNYPSAIIQWKKNNSFIGGNTNTLTVNQSGVYTAIMTTSACGSKTSSAVSVGVIPSSITISSSGFPVICGPNSSVTLSVGSVVGVKYQWKRDGVNVGTNTNTFTATLAGVYTVSMSKNDNSCLVVSNPIAIEAISGTANITPASPITLCSGESIVLRTTPVSGATYNWKKDGISIGFGTDSLRVTESGSYTLTLFKNSCVVESPLAIVSIVPSTINITSSSSTLICEGSSIVLETVSLQGLNYQWKRNGNNVGNNASRHTTSQDGIYTVSISKNGNTCAVNSDSVNVTVIRNTLSITPNESITLCSGDSILLTGSSINGASYQWMKNNTNVFGATGQAHYAKTMGFYKLKATVLSCEFYSNVDTVKVYTTQSAAPTNPVNVTICEGETMSALAVSVDDCPPGGIIQGNYNGPTVGYDGGYQSDINPTINISGTGDITDIKATVVWEKKDQGGSGTCSYSHGGGSPFLGEMSLKLKSPNGTIVTLVPNGFFAGDYQGVITTTFSSIGQDMSSIPQSGTFKPFDSFVPFLSTDPNGVWELVGYDSGGADPLCISGFSLEINVGSSGGTPNVSWWPNATAKTGKLATGTSFTPTHTAPGIYTFYAQSECSFKCPSTRIPVVLTIKAKVAKPIITAQINGNNTISPATICTGQSIVLTATGCTGTILWSNNSTGSSITVTPTNTVSYTAICQLTDPSVCSPSLPSSKFDISLNPASLLITNPIPANTNQLFVAEQIVGRSMVNSPSMIDYKGSKSVSLEPGFSIVADGSTTFKAYIGNCSN